MSLPQQFCIEYRVEYSADREGDEWRRYTEKDYPCSAREVAKGLLSRGHARARVIEVFERVLEEVTL